LQLRDALLFLIRPLSIKELIKPQTSLIWWNVALGTISMTPASVMNATKVDGVDGGAAAAPVLAFTFEPPLSTWLKVTLAWTTIITIIPMTVLDLNK
jgi:hypothetical protein